MKKFIVIYHAPVQFDMTKASPEEMKAHMGDWMKWAEKCGKALLDMGAPLANGTKLSKSGSTPSQRNVVGYSILQADNLEKAKALLKGHPHLDMPGGCEIEVHEEMPLPK